MSEYNVISPNDVDPRYNAWLAHESEGDAILFELILEREEAVDQVVDAQNDVDPELLARRDQLFQAVARRKVEIDTDDRVSPDVKYKIAS
jgi:hypothetical protein